jgi:hypothetical protein
MADLRLYLVIYYSLKLIRWNIVSDCCCEIVGGYEDEWWFALCVRAGKKGLWGKPRRAVAACPSRTRSAPVTMPLSFFDLLIFSQRVQREQRVG